MRVKLRISLVSIFFLFPAVLAFAQDAADDQSADQDHQDRIVDGRPALYSLKRKAHPFSWLEMTFKPVFRSAENGRLHELMNRKPSEKTSGVKFGVDGIGTGSGLGPEVTFFNKDFLGRGIDIEVPFVYTYSRYHRAQVNVSLPLKDLNGAERLRFDVGAGYASRARDDFFGIGNEAPRPDERQFRLVTRDASAGVSAKLDEDWTSSVKAVYRSVGVTRPTFGGSAQNYFTESSVPGLFGGKLGGLAFSLLHDSQGRDKYAFKGGQDKLEVSFNRSVDGGNFEYWQYRFDTQHYLWLTNDGRKLIAVRGLVETNQTTSGREIPFFDMPFLGSMDTLRGFENFRFRDKSAVAWSIEYRYRIWPQMDWGFFVDQGQVAPHLGDLAFDRFHTGYGTKFIIWAKPTLPISFDVGRSAEAWRFYINVNPRF